MRLIKPLVAALVALQPVCAGAAEPSDSVGRGIEIVRVNRQCSFGSAVPPGNYSGMAWLGGNRYAVVSDKSESDGFFVFAIDVDSVSGQIESVADLGFRSAAAPNRDQEGIAWVPSTGKLYISGEKDNRVYEYDTLGRLTGRQLLLPQEYATAGSQYGIEALTYNPHTHRFWLTTESTLPSDGLRAGYGHIVANRLRLQCFTDSLTPGPFFYYEMDEPTVSRRPAEYAMGVSELCALDDGRLLVMEREFYVSPSKIGSWVNVKVFVVAPDGAAPGTLLPKARLLEFKTRLSLLKYSLANYEGMCLGPRLSDGSRVLLMVSDSQNRYKGVLKDYFKTIVIRFD